MNKKGVFLVLTLLLLVTPVAAESNTISFDKIWDFIKTAVITGFATHGKDINLKLDYNPGTEFDPDDDGVETINGVVDLTIQETTFTWKVNKNNICSKWEVENKKTKTEEYVCQGNKKCCEYLEIEQISNKWDEVLFVNKGKYGAGEKNKVSSEIIVFEEKKLP